MEESRDWENIAKHLKVKSTKEEMDEAIHWLKEKPENEAILKDVEKIWALSALPDEGIIPDANAAWLKFDLEIDKVEKKSPTKEYFFSSVFLKIAASIIILLGIGFIVINNPFKDKTITIQTSAQETNRVRLGDGSIIWLNKNSKISYSEDFNVEDRLVTLSGEAFFEVNKSEGKRFTILSSNGKTEVLGTLFNVRAYENEAEVQVTVVRGKVSFSTKNDSKTIFLEPGEKGLLRKNNTITKTTTENNNESAWKTKVLSFDNTALIQVFLRLEDYFGTDIFVDNQNILNCKFTGTFDNPDLNQIIEILSISVDIQYKKQKEAYYFSGKGCN